MSDYFTNTQPLPSLTKDQIDDLAQGNIWSSPGSYYTTITTNGTGINCPTLGSGTFTTNGTGYSNPLIYTNTDIGSALKVSGDADFEGDVKIKGKSILTILESIEDRLSILSPDPEKLEKYEALKKAYNHYKLLEKLIQED